jgi:mRNA-degrading endonuclease RelE of RelBE toxin-antitoxin system
VISTRSAIFIIDISDDAIKEVEVFRKHERQRIFAGMETQLSHQPNVETRNRKLLRPNDLAEWELRLDPFRVFYNVDVDNQLVTVLAVGRKNGERLYIRGVEYRL